MPRLLTSLLLAFSLGFSAAAGRSADDSAAPAARPGSAPAPDYDPLLVNLAHRLQNHFRLTGELQLDLLRIWPQPAATFDPSAKVEITEFPSAPASSMLVRCRLEAGGAPLDFTLTVRAQLWTSVWFAREPLDRGETFDPSLLDVRRVDLLRERDALPAAATADAGDFIFARSVPAGRLLAWRDLGRRPLVRKGEPVEVAAVDGPLTVTLTALATQNGGRGETVLVRNLQTQKEFAAVVVAENRVQVRF